MSVRLFHHVSPLIGDSPHGSDCEHRGQLVAGPGHTLIARSNNACDLLSIAPSSHTSYPCSCWLIGNKEAVSSAGLLSFHGPFDTAEFSGCVMMVRFPRVWSAAFRRLLDSARVSPGGAFSNCSASSPATPAESGQFSIQLWGSMCSTVRASFTITCSVFGLR